MTTTTTTTTSTTAQTSGTLSTDLTVCILGPVNAGKSTLFNRLLCKQTNRAYKLNSDKKTIKANTHLVRRRRKRYGGLAIVSPIPGTTRDRRLCIGRIGTLDFRLWDTAGVEDSLTSHQLSARRQKKRNKDPSLVETMMQQTIAAARESDVVFFLIDGRVGLTTDALETVKWLRQHVLSNNKNKQAMIRVVVNKLEGNQWDYEGSPYLDNVHAANRLGFGPAIPISALHDEGMSDLAVVIKDVIDARADKKGRRPPVETDQKLLRMAILGRPNVGKSTLVNALLGQQRVVTGPTPGLTRDAIATDWYYELDDTIYPIQLVDTAGLRKMGKTDELEEKSVEDAVRAMQVAHVAVLVLDASELFLRKHEIQIAESVIREGRCLVIVVNKTDVIEFDSSFGRHDFEQQVRERLEERFKMLRYTPILALSSKTEKYVDELLPIVINARERWERKIGTGVLNRWIQSEIVTHKAPIKIKYIIQIKGRPPTFMLFCNRPNIPENYQRELTRLFQEAFEMYGMEIRFIVKCNHSNPYRSERTRRGSGLGGKEARKKRLYKELSKTYRHVPLDKKEGYLVKRAPKWKRKRRKY